MVEAGILDYEKHTIRHDRFPIKDHTLQDQLFARVRSVLLDENPSMENRQADASSTHLHRYTHTYT